MTTATTTVFRLTNIDTGKTRHFSTIEAAQTAGDKVLGCEAPWSHHQRNFNDESAEGWQRNNGEIYLSIIPIAVE